MMKILSLVFVVLVVAVQHSSIAAQQASEGAANVKPNDAEQASFGPKKPEPAFENWGYLCSDLCVFMSAPSTTPAGGTPIVKKVAQVYIQHIVKVTTDETVTMFDSNDILYRNVKADDLPRAYDGWIILLNNADPDLPTAVFVSNEITSKGFYPVAVFKNKCWRNDGLYAKRGIVTMP